MIEELGSAQVEEVRAFIQSFSETLPDAERPPPDLADRIEQALSAGTSRLFAVVDDGALLAVGLCGTRMSNISFVLSSDTSHLVSLLDRIHGDYVGTGAKYVTAGGRWINSAASQELLRLGFTKYDRAQMSMPSSAIEMLDEPALGDGFRILPYGEEMRAEISELVAHSNSRNIDVQVFPHFFSSVEACELLLERIEKSTYGTYHPGLSWVLKHEGSAVGICFMTTTNDETGYIPEISIAPEYRRKGLGRAILVHSMKRLVESVKTLKSVRLDVTLANVAKNLYSSLGYNTETEYSMYTWTS